MKRIKSKKNILISWLVIAALVFFDQITKYLADIFLNGKDAFVLIENVFELHYLENQSAAFGIDLITILQNIFHFSYFIENPDAFLSFKMAFFVIITVAMIVLLYLMYLKIPAERRFRSLNVTLIFFIAGAIGNCIDRMFHNYVIDFFYFKLIDFPIFNVADIYVTVSVFVFAILCFFYYKEEDFEKIFPSKKEKKNL